MALTSRYVERKLGKRMILWIDPSKIRHNIGHKRPNTKLLEEKAIAVTKRFPFGKRLGKMAANFIRNRNRFLIPPENYREPVEIETRPKYQKVRDLIDNRHQIEKSLWYTELLRELEQKGNATHKKQIFRSIEEIESFFSDYVLTLVDSMEKHGYDTSKTTDTGNALINKDGELQKAGSGNHRFFVARIVGVKPIPLRVTGVHQEWFERHVDKNDWLKSLCEQLSRVERNCL